MHASGLPLHWDTFVDGIWVADDTYVGHSIRPMASHRAAGSSSCINCGQEVVNVTGPAEDLSIVCKQHVK